MKASKNLRIVLVTAPDLQTARGLAKAALKARVVACANIVTGLESHYWWKGKIEHSTEVLIIFKTSTARLKQLEESVLDQHPYDTPEIVALPLNAASERYRDWWIGNLS